MNRDSEYFYLFYDHQTLIQLDMLSPYSEEISFRHNTSCFELYDQVFNSEEKFVRAISLFNDRMAEKFKQTFGINPVYRLHQGININGNIFALIQCFHGSRGYSFVLGSKVYPQEDKLGILPIGKIFNMNCMIKLHCLMLSSTIFRVGYHSNKFCYKVQLGPDVYNAKISEAGFDLYYLYIIGQKNSCVFKYYNIPNSEIAKFLTKGPWNGQWPEDTKESVFEIIDFINREYFITLTKPIVIEDKFVRIDGKVYYYKQCKKDKWYLSGNIDEILMSFHLESIDALRKFANQILGKKNRPGVFPGCDSKEELITLLQRLR